MHGALTSTAITSRATGAFLQFPGPPKSMQTCVVWRGRGCGGKTGSGRAVVGLARVHGQEI